MAVIIALYVDNTMHHYTVVISAVVWLMIITFSIYYCVEIDIEFYRHYRLSYADSAFQDQNPDSCGALFIVLNSALGIS